MDSSDNKKHVLPIGEYHVRITQITRGRSEKGTPFLSFKFENKRGYINHRLYVTPKGLIYLSKLFEAVGLPVPALEESENASAALLKKELLIDVVETFSSYNNRQYKEVRLFKPLPSKDLLQPLINHHYQELDNASIPGILHSLSLVLAAKALDPLDRAEQLYSLEEELIRRSDEEEAHKQQTEVSDYEHYDPDYRYEKYNGAYGLDDDTVDDAFDGDPESYWNID